MKYKLHKSINEDKWIRCKVPTLRVLNNSIWMQPIDGFCKLDSLTKMPLFIQKEETSEIYLGNVFGYICTPSCKNPKLAEKYLLQFIRRNKQATRNFYKYFRYINDNGGKVNKDDYYLYTKNYLIKWGE